MLMKAKLLSFLLFFIFSFYLISQVSGSGFTRPNLAPWDENNKRRKHSAIEKKYSELTSESISDKNDGCPGLVKFYNGLLSLQDKDTAEENESSTQVKSLDVIKNDENSSEKENKPSNRSKRKRNKDSSAKNKKKKKSVKILLKQVENEGNDHSTKNRGKIIVKWVKAKGEEQTPENNEKLYLDQLLRKAYEGSNGALLHKRLKPKKIEEFQKKLNANFHSGDRDSKRTYQSVVNEIRRWRIKNRVTKEKA